MCVQEISVTKVIVVHCVRLATNIRRPLRQFRRCDAVDQLTHCCDLERDGARRDLMGPATAVDQPAVAVSRPGGRRDGLHGQIWLRQLAMSRRCGGRRVSHSSRLHTLYVLCLTNQRAEIFIVQCEFRRVAVEVLVVMMSSGSTAQITSGL